MLHASRAVAKAVSIAGATRLSRSAPHLWIRRRISALFNKTARPAELTAIIEPRLLAIDPKSGGGGGVAEGGGGRGWEGREGGVSCGSWVWVLGLGQGLGQDRRGD